MKKSFLVFILFLLFFAYACEENEPLIRQNGEILLLKQVKFDSELYYEYTYTAEKLISEEKSKFHYTKHNYNKHSQLISTDFYYDPAMFSSNSHVVDSAWKREEWVNPANTDKGLCRRYFYNNNTQLVKSTDEITYAEYNYDEKNRISRQTFFHEGILSGFIDFTYDLSNNLIERRHYYVLDSGESLLATTTEYSYDTKNNPYKAFKSLLIPGIHTNTNNIIREVYILHLEVDNTINTRQVTENSYVYNIYDFPVKKNGNVEFVYY